MLLSVSFLSDCWLWLIYSVDLHLMYSGKEKIINHHLGYCQEWWSNRDPLGFHGLLASQHFKSPDLISQTSSAVSKNKSSIYFQKGHLNFLYFYLKRILVKAGLDRQVPAKHLRDPVAKLCWMSDWYDIPALESRGYKRRERKSYLSLVEVE